METDNAYQRRVHSAHHHQRTKTIVALEDSDEPNAGKIAMKLRACCKSPRILLTDDDELPGLAEQPCRSRLCPKCTAGRRRALLVKLLATAKELDAPRMVTLTIAHTDTPLREQIDRLRQAFTRLRRRAWWKRRVTAGIYTIEVTWNESEQRWHPHIHAIVDGDYLPHAELKDHWHRATADSYIVHVFRPKSRTDAISYLIGYVAKSSDVNRFPGPQIAEWATAVHGLRLAACLGTLHGHKVAQDTERKDITGWSVLADATITAEIAEHAARGVGTAARLIHDLARYDPRRPNNAGPVDAPTNEQRGRELAGRVRAYIRLLTGDDHRANRPRTPRRNHVDYRQQWFGQEYAPP